MLLNNTIAYVLFMTSEITNLFLLTLIRPFWPQNLFAVCLGQMLLIRFHNACSAKCGDYLIKVGSFPLFLFYYILHKNKYHQLQIYQVCYKDAFPTMNLI